MKIVVASAGGLSRALALAASLNAGKHPSAALEAVKVIAGDDVTIVRSVLDFQISSVVPATIECSGAMAMPIDRFTALVTGFAATAQLIIEDDGAAARVRSGRSRYTRRLFRAGVCRWRSRSPRMPPVSNSVATKRWRCSLPASARRAMQRALHMRGPYC